MKSIGAGVLVSALALAPLPASAQPFRLEEAIAPATTPALTAP